MLLVRLCCISSVLGGMVVVINVTSMTSVSEWFESDVMLFVVMKAWENTNKQNSYIADVSSFCHQLVVAVCRCACNRRPGCA